jgi:hypothetical protein
MYKKVSDIPVPSRMTLTKLCAGIIELLPPRESFVSDISAWDGNVANLFLWCNSISVRARREETISTNLVSKK